MSSWLDRLAEIRSRDWSKVPETERLAMAREVVQITAYASAAATAVPMPFADLALLLPFHTAMVLTVSHCMGRKITDAEARKVALELGAVVGATVAGRLAVGLAVSALKLVVPIGGLAAAPASFAVTWGFGQLTIGYFENPERTRDDLRALFKEAMKDGYQQFSKEALERLRNMGSSASTPASSESPRSAGSPKSSESSNERGKTSPSGATASTFASKESSVPPVRVPVQDGPPAAAAAAKSGPKAAPEPSEAESEVDRPEEGTLRTKKRSL